MSVSSLRTVHTCVRLFLKNSSHLCPSLSEEQFTLVFCSFSRTIQTCFQLFLKNSSNLWPSQEQFKTTSFLRTIQNFSVSTLRTTQKCVFLSWVQFQSRPVSYLRTVKHCTCLVATVQQFRIVILSISLLLCRTNNTAWWLFVTSIQTLYFIVAYLHCRKSTNWNV